MRADDVAEPGVVVAAFEAVVAAAPARRSSRAASRRSCAARRRRSLPGRPWGQAPGSPGSTANPAASGNAVWPIPESGRQTRAAGQFPPRKTSLFPAARFNRGREATPAPCRRTNRATANAWPPAGRPARAPLSTSDHNRTSDRPGRSPKPRPPEGKPLACPRCATADVVIRRDPTSADQATMSPGPTDRIRTLPRPGTCISSAKLPMATIIMSSFCVPSRNTTEWAG